MALFGGANEIVGGIIHNLAKRAKPRRNLVAKGKWIHTRRFGRFFYLLAVFVGAGQEHHVIAIKPLETCQHVTGQRRVGMANVRHIVHIIDRRGDIKGWFAGHNSLNSSA